jgi:hypothetical protein
MSSLSALFLTLPILIPPLTSASYSCPGDPLPDSYINTLPAMMNAFLDFVGVVNRQLRKKHDHRFVSVSVTVYAGRAAGVLSYETFNICCVLLLGDCWQKMEPRTGRTVQVQGNSPFSYPY